MINLHRLVITEGFSQLIDINNEYASLLISNPNECMLHVSEISYITTCNVVIQLADFCIFPTRSVGTQRVKYCFQGSRLVTCVGRKCIITAPCLFSMICNAGTLYHNVISNKTMPDSSPLPSGIPIISLRKVSLSSTDYERKESHRRCSVIWG